MNRLNLSFLTNIFCLLLFCSGNIRAQSGDQGTAEMASPPNVLIMMSDNHYSGHLSCYGDPVLETSNIDQLAEHGVRFTNAFAAPSCTPARGAMLSGQEIWRLGPGANLHSTLPSSLTLFTDRLRNNEYTIGHNYKGWGPGDPFAGGRTTRPAGPRFKNLKSFLDQKNANDPWFFWYSSKHPHRPWTDAPEHTSEIDPEQIEVPPYLPDVPEVREDIRRYYSEVLQFDEEVGRVMKVLSNRNLRRNTVVVVCADNGWQMPRGLANLYDFGTRIPLIVSWPDRFPAGRVIRDFVKIEDFAPTILQLVQIDIPDQFTASSLLPVLESNQEGKLMLNRNYVVLGRERHAYARRGGHGYPARAIRTGDYLFVHNVYPDRWPAGAPPLFGDIDAHELHYDSPTKEYMMAHKDHPDVKPLYELGFKKRPEYELYDLQDDPYLMNNVAGEKPYREVERRLRRQLRAHQRKTGDPRVAGRRARWGSLPYYVEDGWIKTPRKEARRKFDLKEKYNLRK